MKSASKNTEPQFYSTEAPRATRERPESDPGRLGPNRPGSLVKPHLRPSHHFPPTTAASFVQKEGLRFISIIMPLMPCQQKNNKKQKNNTSMASPPPQHR